MKNDLLTTLSVGIDVSSKSNSVCALNFRGEIVFRCKAPNNLPGAEYIAREIINHFTEDFESVTIALESTSYYNLHLASFLSTHESLLPLNPLVYNINAKNVSNYKKSYTDQDKTDPDDAFAIADYTLFLYIPRKRECNQYFLFIYSSIRDFFTSFEKQLFFFKRLSIRRSLV